ncbi:geranylgeranyl reductase [Blastococcus brunescens]|uniref:Geranylgeranyl reductase n=1 Tax=Blastococcus brunescens TaxID=1564165 RepID=A0ABZ1B1K8_9ACTN|nr:geranylgeranyl reductase [Blastococcus sp. BMG 8361]WRL64247.1 geranylgeranyl reductase [Blastococcus sp. BMG 8361]
MEHWDVVVVGGGPAGAACATAARRADPEACVLVLDRADFPRDKVCGDGIAPEALDVLTGLGLDAAALTEGYAVVPRLRLRSPGGTTVERTMHRPARVVPARCSTPGCSPPRSARARSSGGTPSAASRCTRRTSRSTARSPRGRGRGRRRGVRRPPGARHRPQPAGPAGDRAPRLRPRPPGLEDVQLIATTEQRWPAYAWSFPLGDGRANVGYGELVSGGVNRAGLLDGLARLLPGVAATELKAHRLPLSTGRPRHPDGRVLLAGDAASLINPLTGRASSTPSSPGRWQGRRRCRGGGRSAVPGGAAPSAGPAPAALLDRVVGQPVAGGDGRGVPGRGRRPAGVRRRRRPGAGRRAADRAHAHVRRPAAALTRVPRSGQSGAGAVATVPVGVVSPSRPGHRRPGR